MQLKLNAINVRENLHSSEWGVIINSVIRRKLKNINVRNVECGMLANTTAKLRNHIHKEHKNWVEKSQDICYHYIKGFCFRGDSCKFAHVGQQHRNRSDSTARPSTERNWTPACNKGEGCSWLARGAFKFLLKGEGVQRQAPTQHRPNQTNSNQGGRNQFSVNSMAGFPPLRRGNQQTRRNGPRN